MGKGDTERPMQITRDEWDENYERTFRLTRVVTVPPGSVKRWKQQIDQAARFETFNVDEGEE
jgi:hypothetical protein